jgi:hypothetical protein
MAIRTTRMWADYYRSTAPPLRDSLSCAFDVPSTSDVHIYSYYVVEETDPLDAVHYLPTRLDSSDVGENDPADAVPRNIPRLIRVPS